MAFNGSLAWNDTDLVTISNATLANTTILSTPQWQPAFVGTFYLFLASPSFALHILVSLSILKTQGGFRKLAPFYILLANHYLADVMKTLFYILYACPCIWAQSQIYGAILGEFLGEFESVDYCAVLFSTFFMSVNRALAIGAPRLNEKVFTRKLAMVYNCATWLGGVGVFAVNRLLSCRTVLLERKFVFSTVCAQKPAASPGSIIIYIFVYGVMAFYIFALFALSKHRKQFGDSHAGNNAKGYQIRLFLQALGIWMGVLGNTIAFRIIPLFQPSLGTVIATGAVIIGQSYITPVSMLIFVRDTRGGIKQLFGHGRVIALSKSATGNSGARPKPLAASHTGHC